MSRHSTTVGRTVVPVDSLSESPALPFRSGASASNYVRQHPSRRAASTHEKQDSPSPIFVLTQTAATNHGVPTSRQPPLQSPRTDQSSVRQPLLSSWPHRLLQLSRIVLFQQHMVSDSGSSPVRRRCSPTVPDDTVAMNGLQRRFALLTLGSRVDL